MSEENPPVLPPDAETPPPENAENSDVSSPAPAAIAENPSSPSPAPLTIPPATTIKHKTCGKLTDLEKALAASHRKNPGLFTSLPCPHHGPNAPANYPVAEFTWGDDTPFD